MTEKRKKGGQKGNQNALKHGYYAKVLDRAQKRDLVVARDVDGIDEEIDLLRVKLKAVLEKDPENIKLLMTASTTLAGLLKARLDINKNQKKSFLESSFKLLTEQAISLGVNAAGTAIGKKILNG